MKADQFIVNLHIFFTIKSYLPIVKSIHQFVDQIKMQRNQLELQDNFQSYSQ